MNCHGLVGTGVVGNGVVGACVVGACVVGAWVVGRAVVAAGATVMTDGATVMAFTSAFVFTSANDNVVGDEVVDIGTDVADGVTWAGDDVGDPSYSMCMLVFIFTLLRNNSAICENRSGGGAASSPSVRRRCPDTTVTHPKRTNNKINNTTK